MWIILICSTTKLRSRCPFKKKNFEMFVSNIVFFAGSSTLDRLLLIFISLWYERNVFLLDKFRKIYLTFHMWNELTFLWTNWLFCGPIWLLIGTIWLGTIWQWNKMTGYPICPHALTICSNVLTDCSYDLTVDSKQLTVSPSNVWLRQSL